MENQIESLVERVKQATDYQSNKRQLRERIQTDLHFPYNNCLFKVTPSMLAFVATWPIDELYLEDVYENPIEIDKQIFLVAAQQHYQSVMNTWHQQHEELKRLRKI